MRELGWQLNRNKMIFLLLAILIGGSLFPLFRIAGDDSLWEAAYRILFLSLGIEVMLLYKERVLILGDRYGGGSFYRSMPDSLKKEKKRWLTLDVFVLTIAVFLYLVYVTIGYFTDCKNGNLVLVAFFVYFLGYHLFANHPYVIAGITGSVMLLLGFSAKLPVPFWGVVVGAVAVVVGEVWFYGRMGRFWCKDR